MFFCLKNEITAKTKNKTKNIYLKKENVMQCEVTNYRIGNGFEEKMKLSVCNCESRDKMSTFGLKLQFGKIQIDCGCFSE